MPTISDEEIDSIISDFNQNQIEKVGLDRIFSSLKSYNQISDELDDDVLKELKNDAHQRLRRQESRIHHYREIGFRIARTSIITTGILVSGVAILIQQGLVSTPPGNLKIPLIGFVLITISVITGTFWPLSQGYYYLRKSQEGDDEFFTGLIPEKIERGTAEKEILIRILGHQSVSGEINQLEIKQLHISALVSIYTLLFGVGIILVYGFSIL